MNKSRSPLQRFLYSLGAVIAGFLLLGASLDSITNALALVSWPITVGGTAVLLIGGGLVQWVLRKWGLAWTIAGKQHTIRGLGPAVIGGAIGMLILLWVPPFWRLATPSRVQPTADETVNNADTGASPAGCKPLDSGCTAKTGRHSEHHRGPCAKPIKLRADHSAIAQRPIDEQHLASGGLRARAGRSATESDDAIWRYCGSCC
jgi:hypothetical protein